MAVAAQIPTAEPPVAPEPIDPDASAALDWSVPERYDASWDAWRRRAATYDEDFVSPPVGWSINLNACRSRAVRRIERYTFVITGITQPTFHHRLDGRPCRWRLHRVLPVQGLYRVEVTVHTALGASPTFRGNVSVRDYLIVSVGDSLQSGEGVPDKRGKYRLRPRLKELRPVGWKDRRCHRSARSGPARAAKAIENASRHTSVTFLSFACSGADLRHIYKSRYAGTDPGGSSGTLPPQLDAVKALVGPRAGNGEREIDALLVDGGINDLHFSTIIEACASNNNHRIGHTDCVTGFAASKLVDKPQFAARYDQLAVAVRRLNVRETYFNGYPSQVFRGGGCGLLGVRAIGIDAAEGEAMNTLGIDLNGRIEQAVLRHRDEGWNLIDDLTEPFRTHAYCSDDSWFNRLEVSLGSQGDKDGTAHPNRAGHRAFGRILARAIVPNQPQTPFRTATLTIDALKLLSSPPAEEQVDMTLIRFPKDFQGLTRSVTVPRNGQWTPIPAEAGTFQVELFREPASPRHATEVRLVLDRILPIHHGFADGYGPGAHELSHPNNHRIAVRYHITVTGPGGTVPPAKPTRRG